MKNTGVISLEEYRNILKMDALNADLERDNLKPTKRRDAKPHEAKPAKPRVVPQKIPAAKANTRQRAVQGRDSPVDWSKVRQLSPEQTAFLPIATVVSVPGVAVSAVPARQLTPAEVAAIEGSPGNQSSLSPIHEVTPRVAGTPYASTAVDPHAGGVSEDLLGSQFMEGRPRPQSSLSPTLTPTLALTLGLSPLSSRRRSWCRAATCCPSTRCRP